jgi:hypothetical protein
MNRSFMTTWGAGLVVVGAIVITTMNPTSAQRQTAIDNPGWGMPIATNVIAASPDTYYGKVVTLSAGVEQVFSKTAFAVDQRRLVSGGEVKGSGKPILVIAPHLTVALDRRNYILMRGEIVRFDPLAIARLAPGYTLDLAPDVGARYEGQPVMVANLVLDSTYSVLAKTPLPPPDADELSLRAAMKTISPAFAALRAAADESKPDVVTQHAKALASAFILTETIWEDLGQAPAAQWARDARAHVESIRNAAAAGNWLAAKTSAAELGQTCATCHGAYRERQDDGTFRIKPGSF